MTDIQAAGLLSDSVTEWLSRQQDNMTDLLREIVDIDSNSYDKAGVDRVGEVIGAFLVSHGVSVSTIPQKDHGDILRVAVPAKQDGAPILIMGHRDTVFPSGTAAQRPFTLKDGRAYGPGVADMKSGVVMNCFVLAAFAQAGAPGRSLVGLFTGDEEIGSPASRRVIEEESGRAFAAFNSESGRANGNIVIARRGCIFIRLDVFGQSAHSGVNFERGRSAIAALASKVVALHRLSRPDQEISVNVGLISGGRSVNTVAPKATASIDVRYYNAADRDGILGEIDGIVARADIPDTRATWEIYGEFLPMNATAESRRLLSTHLASLAAVGMDGVEGEKTGGAADAGFAAATGTPTLCGLGPVGGLYHSDEEYMEIDSMVPRTQALAMTIGRIAGQPDLLRTG